MPDYIAPPVFVTAAPLGNGMETPIVLLGLFGREV